MLKIAICDDDKTICEDFSMRINNWSKNNNINVKINEFCSGETLIDFIESNSIDVLFLDIELVNLSGVDVGEYIRNHLCNLELKIVFFSSKDTYDRELFKISPFDFIEKPIDDKKTDIIMLKIMKYLNNGINVFNYKKNGHEKNVYYKDILYIEATSRYVKLHMKDGSNELFISTLKNINRSFIENGFVQIHKSYLVNLMHIKAISNSVVCMNDNYNINIGRKFKDEALKRYFNFKIRGE